MNSIDPKEISRYPKVIKDAQTDAVHLDILVCGKCHSAFHFVEDFQNHKDNECNTTSPLRENFANEPKSQVWGFLLWKNSRQKLESNKNSWAMYQMWCKLEEHTREGWITAGKNVQFFSNIGLGKMQEFKYSSKNGGDHDSYKSGNTRNDTNVTVVNTNNTGVLLHSDVDTEEDVDGEHSFVAPKSMAKSNDSLIIRTEDESEQKILSNRNLTIPFAKRTRKNTGVVEERNVEKIIGKTWNHKRKRYEYLIKWEGLSGENNTWEPLENLDTCKQLIDEFERVYVKKNNKQSNNNSISNKDRKNQSQTIDKSNDITEERPQRSSKKKALNMVKAWCGNISDKDDISDKRKHPDDDDDEYKGGSNNESSTKKMKSELFSDNDDDDDSEWSGGEDLGSDEEGRNCTYGSNKKSKSKFSILEATMLNKSKIPELQQHQQQIVTNIVSSSSTTITTMPAIKNEYGNKLQLPHTIAKGNIQSGIYATAKKFPKNQAQKREQVRIIQRGSRIRSGIFKLSSTSSVKPMTVNGLQSSNRYLAGSSIFKPKHSLTFNNKLFTSSSNIKSSASRTATPMKILPTSALSLTPVKQSILPTSSISLSNTNININTSTNSSNSIFLNQNDSEKLILENGLQLSKSDLKEENQNETSLESFTDASGNLMLKDEDGTIYQLAGQDENGQTVLLAQGTNGEQQCLLLAADENSKVLDDASEQLKSEHELHIETDNTNSTEMIMDNLILKSSSDADDQSPGVVAHVLKAESPSPGGTRKLTLLLTDGTCMVAGINKEQYETLGFDK